MKFRDKLVGIGLCILALAGCNVSRAIEIETLVMPGQVIEGHADIEAECSECHAPFSKTRQRDLCLGCHDHENIARDIKAGKGMHGRFGPAAEGECSNCHIEHQGRDADIVGLDEETFEHRYTDFPLEGAHMAADCRGCHEAGTSHRETDTECFSCHEADDSHQGRLGRECDDCHKPVDWQETAFDHEEESGFALTGTHGELECAVCHVSGQPKDLPTDCVACHRIDDSHDGLNGPKCETCHETTSWDKPTFDHSRETDFELEGRHTEIACTDCHTGNKYDDPLETDCIACHRSDDDHQGLNGTECDDCHGSSRWADVVFDHGKDTDFPLRGKHEDLGCASCHKQPAHDVELKTSCFSCHEGDDIHGGEQGEDCGDCHKESGWSEGVQFDHDLTGFPLIGMHAVAPCEACHTSTAFRDAPEQCIECHEDDDVHEGGLGDCASCHSPNDWQLWDFDHETRTGFALDGAHTDLTCRSCHKTRWNRKVRLSSRCATCHRSDDIHSGGFGADCIRCHTTTSFSDLERVR